MPGRSLLRISDGRGSSPNPTHKLGDGFPGAAGALRWLFSPEYRPDQRGGLPVLIPAGVPKAVAQEVRGAAPARPSGRWPGVNRGDGYQPRRTTVPETDAEGDQETF